MLDLFPVMSRNNDTEGAGTAPFFEASPAHGTLEGGEFDGNMFTHRSCRGAQGHDRTRLVEDETGVPALFADKNTYLLHLGRLNIVSNAGIQAMSAELFRQTEAKFIIFEDIRLKGEPAEPGFGVQKFRYRANWRLPVGPGRKYVSSKRMRNLRWCRKKLAETVGRDGVEYRFGRCRAGDVEAVAALNREKIIQCGGRHTLTGDKLGILKTVCAEIGYSSCLYAGDRLIAGNILCVAGKRAFGTMTGYDRRYAKYSPGFLVTLAVLSELEAMGCEEVNFLWDDNRWKQAFHSTRDVLTTLIVRRNRRILLSADYWRRAGPYGKLALKASIDPRVQGIADWIRSLLQRMPKISGPASVTPR